MSQEPADLQLRDLGVLEEIADGGQGRVYRLPGWQGHLLKEYHHGVRSQVDVRELRRLINRTKVMAAADRQLISQSAAWPLAPVVDAGRCVGFVMPEAPSRFYSPIGRRHRLLELQFLLHPVKPMWASLALPSADLRRELAKCYARYFQALHRYDVIVGDVSMKNFLWTLQGGADVFALDCDGYRLNGHHPVVPQPQTPDWEDRSLQAGRATLDSDRYKLALLVLRILLADPYVRPQDVAHLPGGADRLGEPILRLAEQASGDFGRPPAEHWLRALDGRPTVVFSSQRPRTTTSAPTPAGPTERPTIMFDRRQGDGAKPAEAEPQPTVTVERPVIRFKQTDSEGEAS